MIIVLESLTRIILEQPIEGSAQIETNSLVKITITIKYPKTLMFGTLLLPFRSDSLYKKLTISPQIQATTRKIIK